MGQKAKSKERDFTEFENFPLGVARRRSEKFQTCVYPSCHLGPEALQLIEPIFRALKGCR
jgi:hypothetical protein